MTIIIILMIHTVDLLLIRCSVNSFEIRILLIMHEYNAGFCKQIRTANNDYRDEILSQIIAFEIFPNWKFLFYTMFYSISI